LSFDFVFNQQAIVFPKVKEHENPTADAYSVIKQNT